VTDTSGAVLPGVTVTVTQTATGLERVAVTDGTGSYLFTNLPPGPYRLEVTLQGFRTYVQTGLVLTVGATATVNASLELGSLEETITVEAAAPLVDVRSAGISAVVENEAILELPLQGRQVTSLLVLAGAAYQESEVNQRGVTGGVRISVAGGVPGGVGYQLDGTTHNARQQNANLPLPFPDALQEFRVANSGLSAQDGVKSGASVNAVTKSGTNQFSGNVFEFLRHHRFNAPEHFASFGPDGEQVDDGLKRNQFGGTLGGPIVQDKLFFFFGYQQTPTRVTPSSLVERVPTAAMLAGDFTTYASAECNGGRGFTLGAPYVNNRIDPALFSPAAVELARRLPTPDNDCGDITFGVAQDNDEYQPLGRVDYQVNNNHSLFGRYMFFRRLQPAGWSEGENLLLTDEAPGQLNRVNSTSVGYTAVLSSSLVNAARVGYNSSWVEAFHEPYFCPADIGISVACQIEGQFPLTVDGEFEINSGLTTSGDHSNTQFMIANDLTVVRGDHQFSVGTNLEWWEEITNSTSRANGSWNFDGRHTGSSIGDLMVGRLNFVEQGGFGFLPVDNLYIGIYGQDSWRVSDRVTLNAGLRWEPYLGQNVQNGVISVFDRERFDNGVKSTVFLRAPAGFVWAGDPEFPDNAKTGMNKQWLNFSPRVGVAWDVLGDGRTAVRTSYAMMYDFPAGEFHNIHANAPPYGNRVRLTDPVGRLDDPYLGVPGGNPFPATIGPDTPFVPFGAFGTMDPDINSPRIQSWNATIEQQVGTNWGVSASYIGSYSDRLWWQEALNPGVFLEGQRNTGGNLNVRRELYLQNPDEAQFISNLDEVVDWGYQKYAGLKLSVQRRATSGLSLSGNYTVSKCTGTPSASEGFEQAGRGFVIPGNPDYENGYCGQDRRHLSTLTVGYLTPMLDNAALRAVASNWRVSGILSARSGARLNIVSGLDNSGNGQRDQRPDQLSDDIYGPGKDLSDVEPGERIDNYFNRDAFAQPAAGTHGNAKRNLAVGPGFWNIDLAVSRLIPLGTQRLELRLESFNLLNHFNWGNPNANFNSSSFGRITSQAGGPRIMQFGIKYAF
jgi:hypothetical protein